MRGAERVALAIVFVGLATTLVLPGRQTPKVINAFANLFSGSLRTAITGKR